MTLVRISFVVAVFCFLIALLIALSVFSGNGEAWQDGGLVAVAVGLLAPTLP